MHASASAPDHRNLRLIDLSKYYGSRCVADRISLTLGGGKLHSLVGANGAGKSTVLGMASGRITPDSGRIEIDGQAVSLGNPRRARELGIAAIYQELSLIPGFTAVDNIYLGRNLSRLGVLQRRRMRESCRSMLEELGIHLDIDQPVSALTVAQQQMVEIARALAFNSRAVLFDEPASSLGRSEREILYSVIQSLKEHGIILALISHDVDEVLAFSDYVSVMRDGRLIETRAVSAWSKNELVEQISQRRLALHSPTVAPEHGLESEGRKQAGPGPRHRPSDPAITISGLQCARRIQVRELALNGGEIFGLAGLVGSGRSSLLRSLAGLEPDATGQIRLLGKDHRLPRSPIAAQALGIRLIPDDRRKALIMQMSISVNATLGWSKHGFSYRRLLDKEALRRLLAVGVGALAERLGDPVGMLSGGNQQRVLAARSAQGALFLLADEPTKGMDIAAKGNILGMLKSLAQEGCTVLIAADEFEDLIAACDRVAVVREGRITTIVTPETQAWSLDALTALSLGARLA